MQNRFYIISSFLCNFYLCCTVIAVDENLLGFDDTLDPEQLLIKVYDDETEKEKIHQTRFSYNILTTGVESAYTYRNEVVDNPNIISKISSDYHFKKFQISLDSSIREPLANLSQNEKFTLPRFKSKISTSYYSLGAREIYEESDQYQKDLEEGKNTYISPVRASLGWSHYRNFSGRVINELNVDSEVFGISKAKTNALLNKVSAGYAYSWRPSEKWHQIGYIFRGEIPFLFPRDGELGRLHGSASFFGLKEKTGWRMGNMSFGMIYMSDSFWYDRLKVKVGYNYSHQFGGRSSVHQWIVALDWNFISKITGL